jgi:hypothetical protein
VNELRQVSTWQCHYFLKAFRPNENFVKRNVDSAFSLRREPLSVIGGASSLQPPVLIFHQCLQTNMFR